MFPPIKCFKAEDQYNGQTIKNTNNLHKQITLMQEKNKALAADYRNLNATTELNLQDTVYILRNYSCI